MHQDRTAADSLTLDDLLREAELARPLAARLVRDAAAADDLVQEAVMVALTKAQAVREDAGRWFRGIVRNQARQLHRGDGNRAGREQVAARSEALEASDETVQAAERQKDLLEAVLELPPASREVVLLRFYENLPPRKIAARVGESGPTVKKRLERGLGQLRLALEKRYGDRGAWAVALLPLCRQELAAMGAAMGAGGAVGASGANVGLRASVLALAGLGLVGAGWFVLGSRHAEEPDATLVEVADVVTARGDDSTLELARGTGVEERENVSVSEVAAPEVAAVDAAPEPEPTPGTLRRVRLVGLDGAPISASRVEWLSSDPAKGSVEGALDAQGTLEYRGNRIRMREVGHWMLDGAHFQVVGVRELGEHVWEAVIAPAVSVAGFVQDWEGKPVPVARVYWQADLRLHPAGEAERASEALGGKPLWDIYRDFDADESGRFELGWVPSAGLATIRCESGRRRIKEFGSPALGTSELVLKLVKPQSPKRKVRGEVLSASGAPVPGATVRFGYHECVTDGKGEFDVGVPYHVQKEPIQLSAQGPDEMFAFVTSGEIRRVLEEEDPRVTLQLPEAMLSVEGVVLDQDGQPVRGMQLEFLDATPMGGSSRWLEGDWPLPGVAMDDPRQVRVETDSEGRFRLVRLLDREYRVLCYRFDPLTAFEVKIDPRAGSPLEVRLPGPEGYRRVAGTVVDQNGVAAVSVRVALNVAFGGAYNRTSGRPDLAAINALTDEDGGFSFDRVPREHVVVAITNGHASHSVPVTELDEEGSPVVDVKFRCKVLVRGVPEGVTSIAAVKGDGQDVHIASEQAGSSLQAWRIPVAAHGAFPLMWIDSDVVALRLLNGLKEVGRVPVSLVPFETNEVDL